MGVLVDVLEEIRLRIQAGIDAGDIEAKALFNAPFYEIRKDDDFPIITYSLISGITTNVCHKAQATEDIVIQVQYHHRKLANNNIKSYKTSDATGIIYSVEKLLDYLELNRSTSSVDLQLNNTGYDAIKTSYSFDYSELGAITAIIDVQIKGATFTMGAR